MSPPNLPEAFRYLVTGFLRAARATASVFHDAAQLFSIMRAPWAKSDFCLWPSMARGPVGRHCRFVIVNSGYVPNDAVGVVIPHVDAKWEMRLGIHSGSAAG